MKTRNILYTLTLMAYTLSLAHSVIPHHHHKTAEEAQAHHHAGDHHHNTNNHHHDHDKNGSEENSESTGHFFFFNHDINVDVFFKHASVDNTIKSQKTPTAVPVKEKFIPFAVSEHLVFHPPQDDPSFDLATLPSSELRGPPSLFV